MLLCRCLYPPPALHVRSRHLPPYTTTRSYSTIIVNTASVCLVFRSYRQTSPILPPRHHYHDLKLSPPTIIIICHLQYSPTGPDKELNPSETRNVTRFSRGLITQHHTVYCCSLTSLAHWWVLDRNTSILAPTSVSLVEHPSR